MNILSPYRIIWRKVLNKLLKIRIVKKILRFPSGETTIKELFNILNEYKRDRFFVFPSPSCPWGYMFQRPQQLARALSQQGYLVLYCVDTSYPEDPDWTVRGLHLIEKNLYLFNDGNNGRTLSKFSDRMIVWQYWPHQARFIDLFATEHTVRIYDSIDHLSTFSHYLDIKEDYKKSIDNADLVLATSNPILLEILKTREDVLLIPNAVNAKDFNVEVECILNEAEKQIVDDIKNLKINGQTIIGYYGALADWVDYEMITEIARANPTWSIVLIGQKYPNVILPVAPNIKSYKRIRYEALPSVIKFFDVACLPFLINDITISTSPVKIFEYMAAQKPIVSTALPEVKEYNLVRIAENTNEFIEGIKWCLDNINENYKQELLICAENNTWETRVNAVIQKLHNVQEK